MIFVDFVCVSSIKGRLYKTSSDWIKIREARLELSKKVNKLSGTKKKFLKNVIETSSPIQLVILLYEGCLQWLHMSKEEIRKNENNKLANWSEYANYMGMAIDILNYMQDTLDVEASKDFATPMSELYTFMKMRLFKANIAKDPKVIDEVMDLVKDIKDTWKQAIKQDISIS